MFLCKLFNNKVHHNLLFWSQDLALKLYQKIEKISNNLVHLNLNSIKIS